MSFQDALKKSVLEGFSAGDMSTSKMLVVLLVTFLISIYIFYIYKVINKSSLYDKSFHVSMCIISVITAGIILAMQSSIVISLGMVGALSIVRFRTAVKDAMDLIFLFWSIGVGIICGAGLFELAILVSLIVTAGIIILELLPMNKKPYLLIVNSDSVEVEDELNATITKYSKRFAIKSRNIKKNGSDYIYEVDTKEEKALVLELSKLDEISNVSMLTNEGEVRI